MEYDILNDIRMRLQRLEEKLDQLMQRTDFTAVGLSAVNSSVKLTLPLNSINDITTLEENLKDEAYASSLVSNLF